MNPAERLILGHMPLIGVSYQSGEKDEEYRKRFSEIHATKELIEAAVKMDVHKFAAATPHTSPLSPVYLQALRLVIDEGYKIELFPCIEIPVKLEDGKVDAFRRWATYVDFERKLYSEVNQRMIDDPILSFRQDWKHKLPLSKGYTEEGFQKLRIDWPQINEDLKHFEELPVSYLEFGSETDFLTMTHRFDLIGELLDRAKEHGFQKVLLGIHHAGVTIPLLSDNLDRFDGYVTPLNPLGVMMFPTKLLAERAVRNNEKKVFAIKPLAGGRVSPKDAFPYVFSFDVEGCMVGVASVKELKKDIKVAIEALGEVNSQRCPHS